VTGLCAPAGLLVLQTSKLDHVNAECCSFRSKRQKRARQICLSVVHTFTEKGSAQDGLAMEKESFWLLFSQKKLLPPLTQTPYSGTQIVSVKIYSTQKCTHSRPGIFTLAEQGIDDARASAPQRLKIRFWILTWDLIFLTCIGHAMTLTPSSVDPAPPSL
jgi:hypothetical protein